MYICWLKFTWVFQKMCLPFSDSMILSRGITNCFRGFLGLIAVTLSSASSVSGTLANALCTLTHLTLWGRSYCSPHFTDKYFEVERTGNWPRQDSNLDCVIRSKSMLYPLSMNWGLPVFSSWPWSSRLLRSTILLQMQAELSREENSRGFLLRPDSLKDHLHCLSAPIL